MTIPADDAAPRREYLVVATIELEFSLQATDHEAAEEQARALLAETLVDHAPTELRRILNLHAWRRGLGAAEPNRTE